ncbi:MAG: polysaccharide deacetylase family protein [Promethearchaeota archaeon]
MGLEYHIDFQNRRDVSITDANGKELKLPDIFFQIPKEKWLTQESLPKQPLQIFDLSKTSLDCNLVSPKTPIIYGQSTNSDFLQLNSLNIDIFGSAFFMLTRYEEMVKWQRDEHGRFPARASLAYQEGFLERPIINEYIEILWACFKRLWPRLERKKKIFHMLLTHDVDLPFEYLFLSPARLLRRLLGDILISKKPFLAINRSITWSKVKMGNIYDDPLYTFDRIMDMTERNGLRSAFYFISAGEKHRYNQGYNIRHPKIRQLLRNINDRGHEIGLHASYFSYQSSEKIKNELNTLKEVLKEEKIQQEVRGGRQHYLRWEVPTTWQNWEEAGLEYDTTIGFADHVGFRCGLSHEYQAFNLRTRETLKLKERPLIVMESSLIDYMGIDYENILQKIMLLKNRCSMFGGNFVLLWHNNYFVENSIFNEIYDNILQNNTS